MKRKKISAVLAVLLVFMLSPVVAAEKLLVPVGQTVGLQLRDNTITIAAFDDLLGSEAQRAGLKIGDQIVKVNGVAVHNVQQMRDALEEAGDTARVALRRGSKELEQSVRLSRTSEGAKLGVYLKQGITGIGTVTWYDPATGKFGALGHGVNGSAGVLMQMAEGDTYPAQVLSVTKGTSAILVLSDRFDRKKNAENTCIRCGKCVANCPMHLMPNYIAQYAGRGDWERAAEYGAEACVECGSCTYNCPGGVEIVQHIRLAKATLKSLRQRNVGDTKK